MKKNFVKKGIILSILVILVGASILPNISADMNESIIVKDISIVENNDLQSKEVNGILSSIPLFFTKNIGQFPEDVMFQAKVQGATLYFCRDSIVTVFSRSVEKAEKDFMSNKVRSAASQEVLSVVEKFVDANIEPVIIGEGALSHYNNYFIGNDPNKWYTDVPNYEAVYYKDIYPGIDLKYYGYEGSLKYDFIVSPGADPSVIKIQYEGIENLRVTDTGDLEVQTLFGSIIEKSPLIYQEINDVQLEICGRYQKIEDNVFGFILDDSYDPSYPLVIDPIVLRYSTYLGGSGGESGYGIAVDNSGCAYVTGGTTSGDFPTENAYDTTHNGGFLDVFVSKIDPSPPGGIPSLKYSTFLGGEYMESGSGIAVDDNGCAYVSGNTNSVGFPTVLAYQNSLNGNSDAFISKLSSAGNALLYSTYFGGSSEEAGFGIVLDGDGNVYITGQTMSSSGFPLKKPYQNTLLGVVDAFVSKIDPSQSGLNQLIYSTYLGGNDVEIGQGIAIDNNGNAYVTGRTDSIDFPKMYEYYGTLQGWSDVFVSKLETITGGINSLLYSTYLGGPDPVFELGYGIAVDNAGCAYVTGYTASNGFPTTVGAYQSTLRGQYDAFVSKIDPTPPGGIPSLKYSTYLGGDDSEQGRGIAVDNLGFVYVTGVTDSSTNFPIKNPFQANLKGPSDAFVTKIDPSKSGPDSLKASTYLGGTDGDIGEGIFADGNGAVYLTGTTFSDNFPTFIPYDDHYDSGGTEEVGDAFMTKLGGLLNKGPDIPIITGTKFIKVNIEYQFTAVTADPDGDDVSYYIEWGDGTNTGWVGPYPSGEDVNISHSWNEIGFYTIKAKAKDIHGAEGDWGTLSIIVPRSKMAANTLLFRFLQSHPVLLRLLQQFFRILAV